MVLLFCKIKVRRQALTSEIKMTLGSLRCMIMASKRRRKNKGEQRPERWCRGWSLKRPDSHLSTNWVRALQLSEDSESALHRSEVASIPKAQTFPHTLSRGKNNEKEGEIVRYAMSFLTSPPQS